MKVGSGMSWPAVLAVLMASRVTCKVGRTGSLSTDLCVCQQLYIRQKCWNIPGLEVHGGCFTRVMSGSRHFCWDLLKCAHKSDVRIFQMPGQRLNSELFDHHDGLASPLTQPGSDRFRCGGRESNFLAVGAHARTAFTTWPWTSVRRKSRPAWR